MTTVKLNTSQMSVVKWFAMGHFDQKTNKSKKVPFHGGVSKFNAMTVKNLVEKGVLTHDFNKTTFWLTELGCQFAAELFN